jgi:hypothetical protein
VRMPRHAEPSAVRRNVGSPAPRLWVDSTAPTGQGHAGRHTRVRETETVLAIAAEYVGGD